MKAARVILVIVGIALLLVGGMVLLADVKPSRYLGILAWFAGAIIVHDGILAFAVAGVGIAMRRAGRAFRVPLPVIIIVQGALAVAALFALLVVPEILKKSIGTANGTLLPLDYALHLAVFYAALAVITAVAVAGYIAVTRRRASAAT